MFVSLEREVAISRAAKAPRVSEDRGREPSERRTGVEVSLEQGRDLESAPDNTDQLQRNPRSLKNVLIISSRVHPRDEQPDKTSAQTKRSSAHLLLSHHLLLPSSSLLALFPLPSHLPPSRHLPDQNHQLHPLPLLLSRSANLQQRLQHARQQLLEARFVRGFGGPQQDIDSKVGRSDHCREGGRC
jgi:hypothetical protein